jgi:hypothetical protein
MYIRPLHRVLALGALGFALQTGTAFAADYTTINLHIDVERSADEVWKKVGGFCDIKNWLKFGPQGDAISCVYTSGTGDLGTVRRLADRIDEVMVGKTEHSYTYTQPTTTILYHGTLDVVSVGKNKSRINYSLVYDIAPLANDEAKAKDREQRTKSFTNALENMKKLAEGR